MNKKRKIIYTGLAKNWLTMMNKIYGPNCKFTYADYMRSYSKER